MLNLTKCLWITSNCLILSKMHFFSWRRYCSWRDYDNDVDVKCLFQLNCNVLTQWFIWFNELSNDVLVKNHLRTWWFKFLKITIAILLTFWSWCASSTQARFHANLIRSYVIVCLNLDVRFETLMILINEFTTWWL